MENQLPLSGTKTFTRDELIEWLVQEIAENLFIPEDEIEWDEPFTSYGMDSAQAVLIVSALGEKVGMELPPTLFWDYPNIQAVVDYVIKSARVEGDKTEGTNEAGGAQVETVRFAHHVDARPGKEPVALIGIGCRFPGARGTKEFWNLLKNGVDAITEVPENRWNIDDYYHPEPGKSGKMVTRWGGFIDQVDQFDYRFFGISPREAERMDPQQRLLLETTVEAMEDGGIPIEKIRGTKTGVFIGVSGNEYGKRFLPEIEQLDIYPMTGNSYSIVANRLSYIFHLQGPSVAVDTACSSSLTAIHFAVQSLRNGEAEMAIAGGVNLLLDPEVTIAFSKAGMMANDGRCKTFDARANGYVRSEGVGVVLLKPLTKALQDGDLIYAIIRGSAINQDGRSNGLTAPNGQSQEEVLTSAYQNAGVDPGQVDYVEAHGTGTPLGDPIEVQALGAVMGKDRPQNRPLKIGSVKTNIGHLEAAAGVAGVIKTALALKHGELPPSLHFESPNPHIPFDQLPIRVQTELEPWAKEDGRRLAGVSSFGFGGSNAHVVLEEAPTTEITEGTASVEGPQLIPFSARSAHSLTDYMEEMKHWTNKNKERVSLADVAYTASFKRSHHPVRRAIVASDWEEFLTGLEQGAKEKVLEITEKKEWLKPVFVFSGQGPQWIGMGLELMREPVFRERMEECDRWVKRYAGWSVIEELQKSAEEARFDDTEVAQVLVFALQVSLLRLWQSWGIEPAAVVGHSMGEVAAAYAAGIYPLEEATRIIVHRAQVMQPAKGKGKMAAVGLTEEEAKGVCDRMPGRLSLAAVNTEDTTVLAGEPSALEEVLAELRERGIFEREMPGDYAFHSVQMEAYLDPLREALSVVEPNAASLPFYSTVTGTRLDGKGLDVDYWVLNVRKTVRFHHVVSRMIEEGYRLFIELSPHPVLSGAIQRTLNAKGKEGLALASLRREEPERKQMLKSLGRLYELGYQIDWRAAGNLQGAMVSLPHYAWDHETCWKERIETQAVEKSDRQSYGNHPLLKQRVPLPAIRGYALWETELSAHSLSWIQDHQVQGAVIIPASAMVEMALAAAKEINGDGHIRHFSIEKPLFLSGDAKRRIQITLREERAGGHSFEIASCLKGEEETNGAWIVHATGKVS